MQYHRCKCGKLEKWESGMSPQPCEGCEACGTTFSQHPDGHQPIAEHEWETERVETATGWVDGAYKTCRRCHTRERVNPDG